MDQNHRRILDELLYDYQHPVRDPLWKHIYVSPGIEKLFHSQEMQELSRIRQLGPTHLLYPGAVHTRLNHSLGVFHLSRLMIISMMKNDTLESCTPEGIRAFLAASLLHDLGHFPYTHSLKELPLDEHESLAGTIIDSSMEIKRIIRDSIKTDPEMTAAIIDLTRNDEGNRELAMYRSMLSGPLDPDKLDYLNRDAYFCGVPYGIQDIDYIISKLYWCSSSSCAGIEVSGIGALENLIFSKYLMYRYVYWHRTVRSATAMVKRAFYKGLFDGVLKAEDLYRLNDETLFSLCSAYEHPSFSLIYDLRNRKLYQCQAEIPYDPNNEAHRSLEDLGYRTRVEDELSKKASPDSLIIDLPEPISFELSVPVSIPNGDAPPAHVFTPEVVASMERGLRMIRVFSRPGEPLSRETVSELLE